MPHDHAHVGHNHPHEHLHSHMDAADDAAELQVLTEQFIDGFVAAKDKPAYLRLAGVPLTKHAEDGTHLHLVDVRLTIDWQIGTASPAFGIRDLSYQPFPGEMVTDRANMELVYVSLTERRSEDIRSVLASRMTA